MLNKARAKIKTEIERNKSDAYIQVVGEFLLRHLEASPGDADRILNDGKTISKSIDEMAKAARKKASKGRAILTDEEGYAVVLKYFGILPPASIKPAPAPEIKNDVFDVRLEDLLL